MQNLRIEVSKVQPLTATTLRSSRHKDKPLKNLQAEVDLVRGLCETARNTLVFPQAGPRIRFVR
jgi:hypothetical protein